MHLNGLIYSLSKELKLLVGTFLMVINIGFFSSLLMVDRTTSMSTTGIEENYLGNEADENAVEMKFKKSESQILGIIHSHILSMAMLFFFIGILLSITNLPFSIKIFLMVEPFVSTMVTFGGIYFLWKGIHGFKYLVIISGSLMTFTFLISSLIIFYQLLQKKTFNINKD